MQTLYAHILEVLKHLCMCNVCGLCGVFRSKLLESEAVNENLRKNLSRASTRSSFYAGPTSITASHLAPEKDAADIIEIAKKDLQKLKKKEKKKKKR